MLKKKKDMMKKENEVGKYEGNAWGRWHRMAF